MTPTAFCCDITSGTKEEQDKFKDFYRIASGRGWTFYNTYYGYTIKENFEAWGIPQTAHMVFTRILPLSEGIAILKKMVGEEEKARTELADALQKELSWQMDVVIPDLESKLSDALFHIKELCDSIKSFDLAGQHIPCVKALEFFAHNEGFLKPIEDNKKDSDLPF